MVNFGNGAAVWPHLSPENDLFAQSLDPGRKFLSEAVLCIVSGFWVLVLLSSIVSNCNALPRLHSLL